MSAAPERDVLSLELPAKRLRSLSVREIKNILLFAAAYLAAYGAARFFSQRTGARLWLPDSVLLCALLLVPRKKWWLYVLATAPIRFVPWVRAPIASWFLWLTWTNDVAKGLLAAYLLQYAIGRSIRFNSVRKYASYLAFAVILVPLFSAFFGALLRHLVLKHAFAPAFGQWFLGDALANLVLTPTLLLWLSRDRIPRARLFEAMMWAASFLFCLGCAVLLSSLNQSIIALYLPFPFLVWAALRLGAAGACSGIFLTTVFLIFGVSRQQGPLFYLIAHDMHFLQLFLAFTSLPIMFAAILFEERRRTEARLLRNQGKLRQNYKRIRNLAGWLIRGQEEERSRIARELHDGIGQQISLLSIGIDRLESLSNEQPVQAREQLAQLRATTDEVASSVREVARQLHSTVLQHLGLTKALKALCRTFAQQHQVQVSLEVEPIENLGDDISLCLFRVTQEALNNAAKHGRAKQIAVRLQAAELLCLQIRDEGIGFDPTAGRGGLGLVSMEERLRLVGGRLAIKSAPGQGTVVEAVVSRPRRSDSKQQSSRGAFG